jgi:RecB family exonuclease
MPFCTLNEGHYRALENNLVTLLDSIRNGDPVALVTAGEPQAERIRSVLLEESGRSVLAGVEILPAIRHLAQKLSDSPVRGTVPSPVDKAAMALESMSILASGEPFSVMKNSVSSAGSLGSFFEKLLEQGITPEMYSVSTGMLHADPGPVELVTGRLFAEYSRLRDRLCPRTPDAVMSGSPGSTCPFGTLVFYGFYDLNPGQRRFVRRLGETGADIHWFSPVHPSSPWRDVYDRTGEFLRELGFRDRHRVDWKHPLSPQADAGEKLLSSSRTCPGTGVIGAVSVAGGLGAAREVLDRMADPGVRGIPLDRIAVVTRNPGESILPRVCHHEGVPVNFPLAVPLLDMPLAGLVSTVAGLPDDDFHYSSLRSLVASGMLDPELDPGLEGIIDAVERTGIRNGLEAWRRSLRDESPLAALIGEIGHFFDSAREPRSLTSHTDSLRDLTIRISRCAGDDPLLEWIFPEGKWVYDGSVEWGTFSKLLNQHLSETSLELRPADRSGFRILSYEQARGTLWDAVILLDLEEEVFPTRRHDDPRLPAELRDALELPDLLKREREEAYLLYQAMEASSGELTTVCRYLDTESRTVRPSPFVTSLFAGKEGAEHPAPAVRRPASPFVVLLGGGHRGQVSARSSRDGCPPSDRYFLNRAVVAERARMSSGAFDEYDGIIGDGFYSGDVWNASDLENYVRCPFEFMIRKVWQLDRTPDPGVAFEPDALAQGDLVHRCMERLAGRGSFPDDSGEIRKVLQAVAGEQKLHRRLGSRALADVYLEKLAAAVGPAMDRLRELQWVPLETELTLEGRLGDLPVRGRIDLLARKADGSLIVADIKTGASERSASSLARDIGNGILYQPCAYRSLVLAGPFADETGPGVSMAYIRIRPGHRFTCTELPGDLLDELEPASAEYALEISELASGGIFPPVPSGRNCSRCEMRDLCRVSPIERVDRKLEVDSRLSFFRREMVR